MKNFIIALLAAINHLLDADKSDKETIAAQKRKIADLSSRLDAVDPALEAQVNDTLNRVAAAEAPADEHVAAVAEIEPTDIPPEQRTAQIITDATTRGIAPPNTREYTKAIQTAPPVEQPAGPETGQGQPLGDGAEQQPLVNENVNPNPVLKENQQPTGDQKELPPVQKNPPPTEQPADITAAPAGAAK